jgi:ornithine cyclodeaminase/alanine dehydrogenase-like protein (mu-crystallin family)
VHERAFARFPDAVGQRTGRRSADEITIYKSVGIAVEDVATANLVLARARAQGVGTQVELSSR